MVFSNNPIDATDHHIPHADADADETATLLVERGTNTNSTSSTGASRGSRFGLVGFLIGFIVLSSSAFVFLWNQQGTTLPNNVSPSSVSIINSNIDKEVPIINSSNIDKEVLNTKQRDNLVWFVGITTGKNIIKSRAFNYRDHVVTEGQPFGGVFNTNDGKILVKSGRKGSTSVANEFNKIGDGRAFSFIQQEKCTTLKPNKHSNLCHFYNNPKKMNFYVIVDLEIEGIGTIQNIALGQSHNLYGFPSNEYNDWWVISPNCHFELDPHSFVFDNPADNENNRVFTYKCKLTNNKYFILGKTSAHIGEEDHVGIYNYPRK